MQMRHEVIVVVISFKMEVEAVVVCASIIFLRFYDTLRYMTVSWPH
jgi:hypothetical protein